MADDKQYQILVEISGKMDGLQEALKKSQSAMEDFSNRSASALKVLERGWTAVVGLVLGKSAQIVYGLAQDASKYEQQMGTLSNRMGDSMNKFTQWQNTVGNSLGYSLKHSADFATQFSAMFMSIATSQADLEKKTQDVLTAIGVVANKTGMDINDVADKMKYAFEGVSKSAKQLGIDTRASAIQASSTFKKMTDGSVAYTKLSSAMQKVVMEQYVLDQITEKYGNTISDNVYSRMNQFNAGLDNLKLALGQAFLPIENFILPALNSLVTWMTKAMTVVAQFLSLLFGYNPSSFVNGTKAQTDAVNDHANALGGATKAQNGLNSAKEKAKKSGLMSFDEINTLPDKSSSKGAKGGGGEGGLGDLGSAFNPNGLGKASDTFTNISKSVRDAVKTVQDFFKSIGDGIDKVMHPMKTLKDLWDNHKEAVLLVADAVATLTAVILINTADMIADGIASMAETVALKAMYAWDGLVALAQGIVNAVELANPLTWVVIAIGALIAIIILLVMHWDKVSAVVGKAWDALKTAWNNASAWFNDNVIKPIEDKFNAFADGFKNFGSNAWTKLISAFTGIESWFKTNVVDKIGSAFNSLTMGGKAIFENVFKTIYNNVIRPPINGFIGMLDTVMGFIPGIAGQGYWVNQLPQLYNGGITNGKTIAQIGDNVGGQEVVAPLDRLTGIIANTMANTMKWQGGGTGGGSTEIVLKVGSKEFGRVAVDSINQLTKQEGRLSLNI